MMSNPIIAHLFETDAFRVCPAGHPFWYTSGKLGPFYINTQFLCGSEAEAGRILKVIETACAGKPEDMYNTISAALNEALKASAVYRETIELLCEAAPEGFDFISGGERRDFFFSIPVAERLGLPHLSIRKDLTCVLTQPDGTSSVPTAGSLAGKHSLHVCDLVTVASSFIRAWIPAVEATGAKLTASMAVVDRDQGGDRILSDAGAPLTSLVKVDNHLFEQALSLGRITGEQLAMIETFMTDPDRFMREFLISHPDFIANEIAAGGKNADRARLAVSSGFVPEEALPHA